mmetsp:Transcript_54951/g.108534  ORF Transcript_54951/g.108534 Transcript_54951/m.108534 type:complete len:90 (+) Transcript_54951:148-417(+)
MVKPFRDEPMMFPCFLFWENNPLDNFLQDLMWDWPTCVWGNDDDYWSHPFWPMDRPDYHAEEYHPMPHFNTMSPWYPSMDWPHLNNVQQ